MRGWLFKGIGAAVEGLSNVGAASVVLVALSPDRLCYCRGLADESDLVLGADCLAVEAGHPALWRRTPVSERQAVLSGVDFGRGVRLGSMGRDLCADRGKGALADEYVIYYTIQRLALVPSPVVILAQAGIQPSPHCCRVLSMLSFTEEILLLLHDEDQGDFAPGLAPHSLHTVLAGAVLMDLALENRIDTDLERLILVDATPLEDDLLDPTLADIARDTEVRDASYWVAQTTKRGDEIRDKALARLVNLGILESESEGVFLLSRLVSRSRRYPTIDGRTVEEVQLRIMRVLFSDEIPDPRDIVIICLADACGVFDNILSKSERAEVHDRIENDSENGPDRAIGHQGDPRA